jgi:hypothetical protein
MRNQSPAWVRYMASVLLNTWNQNLAIPHLLFSFFIIISGVGLSPLGTAATSGLLYKPQMIDEDECGAIGGMKIGRGHRSTRRKPAPAPLYPPQIPHDQTLARTRAAAVGSKRLTAWAMARPTYYKIQISINNILQRNFHSTTTRNHPTSLPWGHPCFVTVMSRVRF